MLPELNDKTQEIAEDLWKKFDAGEILSEAQTESSVFSYDQAREAYQEPEQNDEQSDSDVSLGGVVDPQPLNA